MEQGNQFYSKTKDEIFSTFSTSAKGLNDEKVEENINKYGENRLAKGDKKSALAIFISQVNNPVIYLLLAAVVVSFIFNDIPEAIAIIIVILLNTIIGFWMEYRAQTSLDALKKMDPRTVKVTRNGETIEIDAVELVPGDYIHLEAGDIVSADARVVFSKELTVDESPLTGESVPVSKHSDPIEGSPQVADQSNMLFKGTAITAGKSEAVVVATGMETEIGKISKMVNESEDEDIPLNQKLRLLSRRLIWVIAGLSILYSLFGWIAGKDLYTVLQTAIAWTVAAIPEGLPIVATISLARGMLRLSRKNVLVRNLSAVETLGETTAILTDKTGTLTKNRLSLKSIFLSARKEAISTSQEIQKDEAYSHFFSVSMLCNDAEFSDSSDELTGDPLDQALLEFGKKSNQESFEHLNELKKINEDPFDSESMMMGTVHETDDNCYVSAKGATSALLEKCTHYLDNDGKKEIDEAFRKKWIKADEDQSEKGLKVIGFSFKELPRKAADELSENDDFIEEMVFLGIAGFVDPVRENIHKPLETCQQAGIRIVMVTGDHPGTALHIANDINLAEEKEDQVIHGNDLENENPDSVSDTSVFARVDPAQKLDIVKHFQDKGEIVGMTGDGVNDAPALKKANIGIAMGKRGTQVAKDVSEMILQDDAFSSIVNAIEQGRVIFENIRKFIIYQLSYHLSEIIIIAAISFTLFKLPLLPLQLLFLNLLSDVFPALALGVGKGSKNIMKKPPKDPDEPIITKKHWIMTSIYGSVIALFVIGAYLFAHYGMNLSHEMCNNIAFFSLAFSQLLHVFDMREPGESIWNNQVTRNKYIWFALGFCFIVLIAAYFIPVISQALSFEQIPLKVWGIIILASVLPITVNQLLKKVEPKI